MSESEIDSNSLFKCDVCLIEYGETRKQKFLPCLHSFCHLCLTEIKQDDNSYKCPICRKLHVDSGDVSSLPNNYFEALKKVERESNEKIALYAKNDELQSALIELLKQNLEKETERVLKYKQLEEHESERIELLEQIQESKSEKILHLMEILSEKEKIIRQLKDRVSNLEIELEFD